MFESLLSDRVVDPVALLATFAGSVSHATAVRSLHPALQDFYPAVDDHADEALIVAALVAMIKRTQCVVTASGSAVEHFAALDRVRETAQVCGRTIVVATVPARGVSTISFYEGDRDV